MMNKLRKKAKLFQEKKSNVDDVKSTKLDFDLEGDDDEKVDYVPFEEDIEVEDMEEELQDEMHQKEEASPNLYEQAYSYEDSNLNSHKIRR